MALSVSCKAEYEPIKTIVLCEPASELLYALIWPEAANFEEVFDSHEAINEHRHYQEYLRRQGLVVYNLNDLVAANPRLVSEAVKATTLSSSGSLLPSRPLKKVIENLGVQDRLRLLTERPTINVTRQLDSVTICPLPNLYFMRDQLIVTDRGVILGRFKDQIRQGEQEIVELALESLGIDVEYRIKDPGVLEGGDFIPAGEWGLIGCGHRTNQDAVRQLTSTDEGASALGYKHLAVIIDPKPDIQEMHLDTYFMLVGRSTCLVVDTRVNPPENNAPDKQPIVEIYDKSTSSGKYTRRKVLKFKEFLVNELNISTIIELTEEDQRAYGINVLCLDDNKVLGSKSDEQDLIQLQTYQQKLASALVKYHLISFTNIRKGFGSNHCMSQVYLRG